MELRHAIDHSARDFSAFFEHGFDLDVSDAKTNKVVSFRTA